MYKKLILSASVGPICTKTQKLPFKISIKQKLILNFSTAIDYYGEIWWLNQGQ